MAAILRPREVRNTAMDLFEHDDPKFHGTSSSRAEHTASDASLDDAVAAYASQQLPSATLKPSTPYSKCLIEYSCLKLCHVDDNARTFYTNQLKHYLKPRFIVKNRHLRTP